jgi:hypothetical protein
MDACVKAIVANFLQQVSASVYISIPTGHADFHFSWLESFKDSRAKREVIGEQLIPLLSIAAGKAAYTRLQIVHKCAFGILVISYGKIIFF